MPLEKRRKEQRMEKYAAIEFGPEEAEEQRKFLNAMNGCGIIQLTNEELDEDTKEFERDKMGRMNHIVLHGDEKVKHFENIMHTFFENREYKITDDPDNEAFRRWLAEKANRITE
jgi:hypothetical protein